MAEFNPATKPDSCFAKGNSCPLKRVLQLPNLLFIGIIRFYQIALSPFLPRSCRFHPSCSSYGYQAFKRYPFYKAFYLTAWRILRCNPFNKGGDDPLP